MKAKRLTVCVVTAVVSLWMLVAPGARLTEAADRDAPSSPDAAEIAPARPDARPGERQVSAAALVRAVYESQAWLDTAHSILIRTQKEQIWTDEERQWQASRPRGNLSNTGGNSELTDYLITTDWAWDETRIHYKNEIRHLKDGADFYSDIRIWNDKLAINRAKSADSREYYVLANKPSQFFEHMVTHSVSNPWGASRGNRFWWLQVDVDRGREFGFLQPEDFERIGAEEVNGQTCHVVESRAGRQQLHIGVADGRLYRRTWFVIDSKNAGYDYLALLQKVGGLAIKTAYHWEPWLQSLEPAERRRARRDLALAEFNFAHSWVSETTHDFREVVPSCWFPFRRLHVSYNRQAPAPFISVRTEETVKEMTVNQPLADELFHVELVDGVNVATDWRYDPPIRYTYSQDQPEAERVALCEKARHEQARGREEMERRQATIKSRVGKAPQALPETGWLIGGPLNWVKLRGKVVVLHFWDVNCGPCQNEIPFLQSWSENSAESGVVVIGIHRRTDDVAAVRKKLADFGANYHMLIDTPPLKPDGLGLLHDWFGTTWWPHTVLVNKDGVIAGHGQLWMGDIAEQIKGLAAQPE
jgi:thiol-disulfide isomerase/thioredoxin